MVGGFRSAWYVVLLDAVELVLVTVLGSPGVVVEDDGAPVQVPAEAGQVEFTVSACVVTSSEEEALTATVTRPSAPTPSGPLYEADPLLASSIWLSVWPWPSEAATLNFLLET